MLVIEVELLTGRYAATAHDNRRRAEWPPHPARFFSALVAALHDGDPVDETEREAVLWLERQPPPALDVDLDVDARVGRRDVHDVFVPVNDVSVAGNAWPSVTALRDAEAALVAAERDADAKNKARRTKEAAKAVTTAQRKLTTFLAHALSPSEDPSTADIKAAAALLPDRRTRQLRTFPVVVPRRPTFSFIWDTEPNADVRAAIKTLCARVTRLGHASSLVRCTTVDRVIEPTLVPAQDGEWVLRMVNEGQLKRLEEEFKWHHGVENRVLPSRPQRYGRPVSPTTGATPRTVFMDDWIIYERREGARLMSSRGADVARALRAALLEANASDGPLPSVLSGHGSDGGPSERPHVAFVACPFIGHPHADGSVQGCAIVLPRAVSEADRRNLLRLIATWEKRSARDGIVELAADGLPTMRVARVETSEKLALSPWRWCKPSKRFITATPIALDRHPGNLRSNTARAAHKASVEAQRAVADACERIGLPRPASVEIGLAPMLQGAQPVWAFRSWPGRPGRYSRARVHADIRFDRAVAGPVLLGAGRYFGLGFCLPVQDGTD